MKNTLEKITPSVDDLIINLTRSFLNSEKGIETDQFTLEEKDWDEFFNASCREGLSGVIYYTLAENNKTDLLPGRILQKFEQEYLTNIGRNLLIDEQLNEVAARFDYYQIPTLLVRGATFFKDLYPDSGIRPLIDMDFVIHEKDFSKVQGMFKEMGFQYHECYPFFIFKDDIYVDLHLDSINFWRIKSWPSAIHMDNQAMREKTGTFRNFSYVHTLGTADTILHCSEHLMRHSFERLIWFLDIAMIIQRYKSQFDWDAFVKRAFDFNAYKPSYNALSFLNAKGFCHIPTSALTQLGGYPMNYLEKKNFRSLLDNNRKELSGDLLSLFSIPSLPLRLAVLWNGIFIKQERFPLVRDKLSVFSYIKRAFRLFGYLLKKTCALLNPKNILTK